MKTPIHKHRILSRAAMAGLVLAAGPLLANDVLFLDTFNRPDSTTTDGTGLNEATSGKSGALGTLTWTGKTALNSPTGNIVDINGNSLRIDSVGSNGADGGLAYISDHNFNDASIKSAGTFKVSVDIASASSAGDGRNIGFGVGSSLSELASVTSASAGSSPSDVFFVYDSVGASQGLRVFHNGVAQSGGLLPFPSGSGAPSPPDTISGTFTFADMNSGTTLNYELFVNGVSVVTGSTAWSGTDENYICLMSNYTNASTFDNFNVTVPGPPVLLATNPADSATNISPSQNLVATFDEPITLNTTGSVTIKNLTTSTNTIITLPGDVNGTLTVAGNVLTIDPTADLGAAGYELAIEISADAIKDSDGGFYTGILSTDVPHWSFTIDNIPPGLNYLHPIAGSGNAPLDGALFISFDESPVVGSGNIVVHRTSDNSVVEAIGVTSGNVTVRGSVVSITPTIPLSYGTNYYVLVDSGAFNDALGNAFEISDLTTWTFKTIANDATVLFGDSYNRPDSDGLNVAKGKYGSLSPLNYTPKLIGVGNVQLSSGQLLIQSNENAGSSGALVYLNHNFNDAAISTAGGFSINVDINAYASGGTTRYMSVAVGQSSADLDAQTSASAAGSSGDLVVGYRNSNNTLEIRGNGVNTIVSGLPAPPTTMRIDYSLPDFTTGSTVDYKVFFNGSATAFTSGTFTWSGTNENYISLSSNLIQTFTPGVRNSLFDNLQVHSLAAVGGFASWITGTFANGPVPGNKRGPNDDADNDGISNLIEYAIAGHDPTVANSTIGSFNGNTLSFTKSTSTSGLTYAIEESTDLGVADAWAEVPAGASYTNDAANISLTLPAGPSKDFLRLRVLSN